MATISERLAYILTFDTSSGVKSLQKLGSTADRELGKAEQRLDKVGAGLSKFGAGALAAAGIAGAGLMKMAQGAADADANMSALEQVVGEVSAAAIGDWAENSARSVGLASKSAVEASTQFAGLGKIIGLGGQELADFATAHVELAADMAAFKNVAPEQAIQDISAAYAGSTEVLRKYNIFLDDRTIKEAYARETGEELTGTLTTQQRIIGINSELYRQGADMLGQFGRESGELSGQQVILRAELTNLSDEIGAGVLPMMVGLFGAVNNVVGGLGSLDKGTNGAIGRFAALGTAGVALLGSLSLVAGQAIKMRDRFTTLGADGTRSLNGMGKAARGLGVAMGVASAALVLYSIDQAKVARVNEHFADSIDEIGRSADDALAGRFVDAVAKGKFAGEDFESVIENIAEGSLGSAQRLLEAEAATGALSMALQDANVHGGSSAEVLAALEAAVESETAAQIQANATTELGAEALDSQADAADGLTEATEYLSGGVREATEAIDANIAATQEAIDKRNQFANATWDAEDAEDAFHDSVAAMTETLKTNDVTTREGSASVRDAARATDEMVRKQLEAEDVIIDSARGQEIYKERLTDTAMYIGGPLGDEILEHVDRLDGVPDGVVTTVTAEMQGIEATRARLEQILGRQITIPVNTYNPSTGYGGGGGNVYGATGGIVTKPTLATIGEAGPEAVIPLNKTPGSSPLPGNLGGGSTTVYNSYNITAWSPKDVVEALKVHERRNGPLPIKVRQ